MFCTNCGKAIVTGSNFCPGCGVPVDATAQQTADTQQAPDTQEGYTYLQPVMTEQMDSSATSSVSAPMSSATPDALDTLDAIGSTDAAVTSPSTPDFMDASTMPPAANMPPLASPAPSFGFQAQMHQPAKKEFPIWGIVLAVAGALIALALCAAVSLFAFSAVMSDYRDMFDLTTWYDEEFRNMRLAELEEVLAKIDDDVTARNTIAGAYKVDARYFSMGWGSFSHYDFINQDAYTFNADGSFVITYDFGWGDVEVYQGEFVIERVTVDDIDAFNKPHMKDIEERADSDWYRLILHSEEFNWDPWYEMFISRKGSDDIILYDPMRGESNILIPAN